MVSLVESLGLQDLPLIGANFISFDYGTEGAQSKLDGFFVRNNKFGLLEGVVQQVVFKFSSDHLPILLASGVAPSGPRLFKFVNACCEFLNLQSSVKQE